MGRQLDLFSIHEDVGPGLIIWHPKGGRVRTIIQDYWQELHDKHNYHVVYSPHVGRSRLWRTSGHLDFYSESMYPPMDIEGQEYYLKAHELPLPHHDIPLGTPKLSRASHPLRRAGHRLIVTNVVAFFTA